MRSRPPRRGPRPNRAPPNRAGAAFAFVFCVGSGLFALWIAITNAEVQGGFPLLPAAVNQMIGRGFFGVCGLIRLGVAVLAARDLRSVGDSESPPHA